jgi:hypothetical protein
VQETAVAGSRMTEHSEQPVAGPHKALYRQRQVRQAKLSRRSVRRNGFRLRSPCFPSKIFFRSVPDCRPIRSVLPRSALERTRYRGGRFACYPRASCSRLTLRRKRSSDRALTFIVTDRQMSSGLPVIRQESRSHNPPEHLSDKSINGSLLRLL